MILLLLLALMTLAPVLAGVSVWYGQHQPVAPPRAEAAGAEGPGQ